LALGAYGRKWQRVFQDVVVVACVRRIGWQRLNRALSRRGAWRSCHRDVLENVIVVVVGRSMSVPATVGQNVIVGYTLCTLPPLVTLWGRKIAL
jgi:hypothetical protein